MPMVAKIDINFCSGGYGWKETYWKSATDLVAATAIAKSLTLKRWNLLATDAYPLNFVCSNVDVRNDSLVSWIADVAGRTLNNVGFGPWQGVLLRLTGKDPGGLAKQSYLSKHYLRGVPMHAFFVGDNGRLVLNAAWKAALDAFLLYIKQGVGQMCFPALSKNVPKFPITAIEKVPLGTNTRYTTVAPHGLKHSDPVLVHGFTGSQKALNGRRFVIGITPTTLDVSDVYPGVVGFQPGGLVPNPSPPPAQINVGPSVSKQVSVYVDVRNAEYVRPTTHKTAKRVDVGKAKVKGRVGKI